MGLSQYTRTNPQQLKAREEAVAATREDCSPELQACSKIHFAVGPSCLSCLYQLYFPLNHCCHPNKPRNFLFAWEAKDPRKHQTTDSSFQPEYQDSTFVEQIALSGYFSDLWIPLRSFWLDCFLIQMLTTTGHTWGAFWEQAP